MEPLDFAHQARRLRVGTLVRLRWIAAAGQMAALLVARFLLHIEFPLRRRRLCVRPAARVQRASCGCDILARQAAGGKGDDFILAVDIGAACGMLYLTGRPRQPVRHAAAGADNDLGGVADLDGDRQTAGVRHRLRLRLAIWRDSAAIAERDPGQPAGHRNGGFLLAIVVSAVFVADLRRPGRQGGAPARRRACRHRTDPHPRAASLATRRARRGGGARTRHAARDADRRRPRTRQPAATSPRSAATILRWRGRNWRAAAPFSASSPTPAASPASRSTASNSRRCWKRSPGRTACRTSTSSLPRTVPSRGRPARATRRCSTACAIWRRTPSRFARRRRAIEATLDPRPRRDRRSSTTVPAFPPRCCNGSANPTSPTAAPRAAPTPEAGLGLGLFIAKALLERTGAEMRIGNLSPPRRGARAAVSWPRGVFRSRRALLRRRELSA